MISHFVDIEALPIIPLIKFRLEAGGQSRIKILSIVYPINYRIFLETPLRFLHLFYIPRPARGTNGYLSRPAKQQQKVITLISYFSDIEALTIIPSITFSFEAGG
jgi:hypothetical protein